jgi:two-component system LytT family response regulator
MLSAVIIDDENDSIDVIISLIIQYQIDVKVIGRGNSVKEGIEILSSTHPDVVFLDIKLGDELGFTLLNQIEIDFQIIFISAYDKYAINAFKYSAVDFLLKPIDPYELINAIKKTKERVQSDKFHFSHLKILLNNLNAPRPFMLSVPTSDGLEFVNIDDIVNIKAEGSYSVLSFQNNRNMMVSKNIGEFQDQLPEEEFCRVHNSYIINLRYIKKIKRKGGLSAEMSKGENIPISRNRKDSFMQRIDNYVINK